tara:strand:- start:27482 stop:28105 length:624 start_codon:yes stop_codon:yes gene_type:complete
MKKICTSIAFLTALTSSGFAQENEHGFFANAAATYTFPGQDEWESAIGVEGRIGVGIAGGLRIFGVFGYSSWELDSESDSFEGDTISIDGDAGIVSLGAGLDYTLMVSDNASFVFAGSIVYQIVDSDVSINLTEDSIFNQSADIDIDDAVAAFVGVDFLYDISDKLGLFVGGGYLFNLDEPEVSISGFGQGDSTKFDGATIRAGIEF